jgi:putative oxidoreductase
MDVGLLLIRVVLGALLVGHGTQKLFGWFGGHGLEATGGFFESLGYRPGRQKATLAGAAEAGGGALLVLGLLTPLGSAALIGVMVNAVGSVHRTRGPWVTDGGYEYNLLIAAAAAAIAFTGPGHASVDAALGWYPGGFFWGLGALAVGLGSGFALLGDRDLEDEFEVRGDADVVETEVIKSRV